MKEPKLNFIMFSIIKEETDFTYCTVGFRLDTVPFLLFFVDCDTA